MNNKTEKSLVLTICIFLSVGITIYTTYYSFAHSQELFTLEGFDLALAKRAIWLLSALTWINYSALAIGLVISVYSQTQNNFSDLSRKYLAYSIYAIFTFNLLSFTWKNWL